MAALVTSYGCSVPARGKVVEFRSATVPKTTYQTVAVIAVDDNNNNLRMSARVRNLITEAGFKGVRRAGRWGTEEGALTEICADSTDPVQGVLLVSFDTLILRECKSKQVAYKINGGGKLNLDQMADHLVLYMKSVSAQT